MQLCLPRLRFPPTIPEAWTRSYYVETAFYTSQQSSVTSAVRARDATCRITNHFNGTEVAHLCPEHEQEWFLRNSMAMWNTDLTLDPDNLLMTSVMSFSCAPICIKHSTIGSSSSSPNQGMGTWFICSNLLQTLDSYTITCAYILFRNAIFGCFTHDCLGPFPVSICLFEQAQHSTVFCNGQGRYSRCRMGRGSRH
jgi:hypothetical protein